MAKIDFEQVEDLLTKKYSAAKIIKFYDQFLEGVKRNPELAESLKDSPLLNPPGKVLKKTRVKILLEVFKKKELFNAFYSEFPDHVKKVIETLTWYGQIRLSDMEKKVGRKISTIAKGRRYADFNLKPGFELVLTKHNNKWYYDYTTPKKEGVVLYINLQLREVLKQYLPKPEHYTLKPVKKRTKTAFHSNFEPAALSELTRMAEFIEQGHMSTKKNGQPSVKGLRDLIKISGISEFYPRKAGKALELMRTRMLAYFLIKVKPQIITPIDAPEVFLKESFKYWIDDYSSTIERDFLYHIDTRYSYYWGDDSNDRVKDNLFMLLGRLSSDKWTDVKHIMIHCILRNINLTDFFLDELRYKSVEETEYGSWMTAESIDHFTAPYLLYMPLLKAFFFMAAALGIVEICYNHPSNSKESHPDKEYLTVYDGLKYVRLTPLGKYVTGQTDKYEYMADYDRGNIILDESRLILLIQGANPAINLIMEKIMEPAGHNRYRMTFASLLSGCSSRKDVLNKIKLFHDYVCKKPPEIWENFFEKALKRIDPLKKETQLDIFNINNDKELMNILTTDPIISRLILKVEGRRIA